MVEIIKRGSPKEDRPIQLTCRECDTVFSFCSEEATPYDDRDGAGLKIKCPVCDHLIWRNHKS